MIFMIPIGLNEEHVWWKDVGKDCIALSFSMWREEKQQHQFLIYVRTININIVPNTK